jgi:hypothetical protein
MMRLTKLLSSTIRRIKQFAISTCSGTVSHANVVSELRDFGRDSGKPSDAGSRVLGVL